MLLSPLAPATTGHSRHQVKIKSYLLGLLVSRESQPTSRGGLSGALSVFEHYCFPNDTYVKQKNRREYRADMIICGVYFVILTLAVSQCVAPELS